MRKQKNKVMIVILTIMIAVFGAMPEGEIGSGKAFAEETGVFAGDGSGGNPFLIGTADQLDMIRDQFLDANFHFKLTNNIDLSDYAAGVGWVPIGTVDTPFYGHFDGDGYKIMGLTIDNDDALGLFGSIGPSSSVSNIKLENVSIKGLGVIAGLVGKNDGGTIENSCVTGSVSGVNVTGGLVGMSQNGGTIRNSCFSGNVDGTGLNTGGLVGLIIGGGTIGNNDVKGSVNGDSYVGGLIGYNDGGEVRGNSVSADVSGTVYIGGLIGFEQSGSIVQSYSSGQVSGNNYVGGLIGYNGSGQISDSSASGGVLGWTQYVGGLVGYNTSGKVSNSYASGNVSGSSIGVGGLVGYIEEGEISDSYALGEVSGTSELGGLIGRYVNARVINSYATGKLNGDSYVGGLIGYIPQHGPMPINSFYDIETTGQSGSNGGVGLVTSEMRGQSAYEAESAYAWDFSNIWAIDSVHNGGYPYLRAVQVYLDYDGNGYTSGTVPTGSRSSVMPGVTVDLYAGTLDLEKTGYVFDGWNTQADGSGSAYVQGDSYTLTSNTTLYANWILSSKIAKLTSSLGIVSTGGTANESITDIPYGTTLDDLKLAITPMGNATFDVFETDGITIATTLASGKKVIVTSEDGTANVSYMVTMALESEKDILDFGFAEQTGAATIDAGMHTVAIEVTEGSDLSRLVAMFALSDGATAKIGVDNQASGVTANDFTNAVTYTVHGVDGSVQDWTVIVTYYAVSNEKDITNFSVDWQTGPATIDVNAHTVEIEVESGTDLVMLFAEVEVSMGAMAIIDGMPQFGMPMIMFIHDFTDPFVITVIAEDGSMQDWTVIVTVGAAPVTEIKSFAFSDQTGPATIDVHNHSVAIYMLPDSDLSNLTATFTLSDGATAMVGNEAQISGQNVNDFTNPVTYTVQGVDGSVQDWTVIVNLTLPIQSGTDITSFSFVELSGQTTIDANSHTVAIDVQSGSDLSSLTALFTLSHLAMSWVDKSTQKSGYSTNDFTNPVIYTVVAEDGSMQDWTVTVSMEAGPVGNGTDITAFSVAGQIGPAMIDANSHKIEIEVLKGIDLSNLAATFTLSSGASARVGAIDQTSGKTVNNFKFPVVYSVIAVDGSVQDWTVTVTYGTVTGSNETDILDLFVDRGQTGPATIDAIAHTVEIEVESGTDRRMMVAYFYLSMGAMAMIDGAVQLSGASSNDFTSPVVYTVVAEDGSMQDWTVIVTVGAAPVTEIKSFAFSEQTGQTTINAHNHSVTIYMLPDADLSNLTATFTLSDGATATVGNVAQISGKNVNDFTNPVTYTVQGVDGSVQNWSVIVTLLSSEKDITNFSVDWQTGPATIDVNAHTVEIEVESGTDLVMLYAEVEVSMGAMAIIDGMPQFGMPMFIHDFTDPFVITVIAEDSSTQDWTVIVTVGVAPVTAIKSFAFSDQTGPSRIDTHNHSVEIYMQPDADLSKLTATFTLSDGATATVGNAAQISGQNVNDFTNPVTYTVQGEDGSLQNWTVFVNLTLPIQSGTDITSFSFVELSGRTTIDANSHTVAIDVRPGSDLSSLTALFTLSHLAMSSVDKSTQKSGISTNDFTNPVIYTVMAEDGSVQDWTVTLSINAGPVGNGTDITAFSLGEQTGPATIDANAHTVEIEVESGTDRRMLVVYFDLSMGAVAIIDGAVQFSGVHSFNDFTSPVVYSVIAEDGSVQDWTVTVSLEAVPVGNGTDITAFSLDEQTEPATIDETMHRVSIEVSNGTDLSNLAATFTLSAGASAKVGVIDQGSGTTGNNFNFPVVYSVIAEDGSVQDWTVIVIAVPSNAATLTSTIGTVSTGGTPNETIGNIPNGITLAVFKAAITPATNATFEVYEADGTTVATTMASGNKVIITAQDGTTKVTYIVTVDAAPLSNNGGGSVATPPSDTIVSSTDGRLTLPADQAGEVSFDNAIVVSIPANATDKDLKITIDKVTDSQKLLSNNDVLVSSVYEILKNFSENFTNPITLVFTFNPDQIESGQMASVFYYDETKKSWVEVTDGIVNGNQITVSVNHFTKFAVFAVNQSAQEPSMNLSDVDGHWAESAIKQAVSKGIVTGYPDGTFKPNLAVTRAEFVVMLMNAIKPQGTVTGEVLTFTDAAKIGTWAKNAVVKAVQAGIISGYTDGTFRPNEEITRVEMAMMIAKASGLALEANATTTFGDDKNIPAWAKSAVALISNLGYLEGKGNNKFDPNAIATRGEALTVLLKMSAQMSK